MRRKINLTAYFMAACELEQRHGVNIGTYYTTETSARSFIHFIAEVQQKKLVTVLQQAKFFSIVLDASTDCC